MVELVSRVYFIAYLLFNIFALLLLWISWKHPKAGRLLFSVLFLIGSWTNWNQVIHSPDQYLNFADFAFFTMYVKFITGWFSTHILLVISCIALLQAFIAFSFLLKGWIFKAGVIAAIVFLISMMPLGTVSAFPCPLILVIALLLLYRKGQDYIWKSRMTDSEYLKVPLTLQPRR